MPKFSESEYVEFEEIPNSEPVKESKEDEIIEAEVEVIEPDPVLPPRVHIFESNIDKGLDFSIFSQGLFNIMKSKF